MMAAVGLMAVISLSSCEDILGHWEKPTPAVAPEEFVYAFSLRNLADDADVVATALKVTDQTGREIATGTRDGKYTIKVDDLDSATELWLEATAEDGKKYIQKAKVEELSAIAEAGKLTMATLGNIIGVDGKFYANKASVDAATTTGAAMIVYLGNEGETNTTYNHGLAIALGDAADGNARWGVPNTTVLGKHYNTWSSATPAAASDANTDMAGIANTETLVTKAAEDASNYQAGKAASDYTVAGFTPATYGFSGWFLPSAGQWYIFLNGMCGLTWTGGWDYSTQGGADFTAVNNVFTVAGYGTAPNDAKIIESKYYWSSTQYDDGFAVYFEFESLSGVNAGQATMEYYLSVRPFLAF